MIDFIRSGGQEGADLAGLDAAKKYGITTGGCMPKGFKTQDGNKPHYFDLMGIKPNASIIN